MTAGLEGTTRLNWVTLVLLLVLIGMLLFYFRKKENDGLNALFRLEERLDRIELKLEKLVSPELSPGPAKAPANAK